MTANFYTLLVGIDEYLDPVPPLRGCINDITAAEAYLTERIDGYQLRLQTLKNSEATRAAIIDGFRQHLRQAQHEDIVLFYYSGHGSQEPAPEEFWDVERQFETIVCYDSRLEGGLDLADKELAKLIAEVAENDPHICIIMDCCHSGGGTRNLLQKTAVRRVSTPHSPRSLDDFIFSHKELTATRSVNKRGRIVMPKGRHVLLAACRDYEEAKEYYGDGQHRGAFSYFLMDTLQKATGNLTYRDLFKRTSALIRTQVSAQSPQLEVTNPDDENQLFLNGALADPMPLS